MKVYIGPGVKTHAGTDDNGDAVPAYSFGEAGAFLGQDVEGFFFKKAYTETNISFW